MLMRRVRVRVPSFLARRRLADTALNTVAMLILNPMQLLWSSAVAHTTSWQVQ